MTTADLVGVENEDIPGKSGLVEAVERCRVSIAATSSSSDAAAVASSHLDAADDRAKSSGSFDIRKFTSAISGAKSKSEIEKIVREYSRKPSKTSGASDAAGKTSESPGEAGGSGDATESRQSVPESGRITPLDSSGSLVGNSTLTASTKSYSWSSSLPNGSRLETLASNAVNEQPDSGTSTSSVSQAASVAGAEVTLPKTVTDSQPSEVSSALEQTTSRRLSRRSGLPEQPAASSTTSQTTNDRIRRSVDAGDATQVAAASTKRRSSKSLRVGDFLPSADASETTFGSPRVSLIARLSRPRHLDECTLDQSQFERTVTVTMSSQPAVSTSGRLMSTPATYTAFDSGVRIPSSQSGIQPAANDQVRSQQAVTSFQ